MNILTKFPNATNEQKEALLKAEKEWADAVMAKKLPKQIVPTLDGGLIDPFKDLTDEYKKKVKEIMKL